jgi:hypothetical protein
MHLEKYTLYNNEMNYTVYMKRNRTIYTVAYRPAAKWRLCHLQQ